jgi:DNA-binding MarR family transcriptional regulator
MTQPDTQPLPHLIDRIGRLSLADDWSGGLNPSQHAALGYLAQANRFSRAPSHVAAYLGATRGTVSQTLHALERKGFVVIVPSTEDKRTIRYEVTEAGQAMLRRRRALDAAIDALPGATVQGLQSGVAMLLRHMLAAQGGRSFGLCRTCRHHRVLGDGAHCALLDVALLAAEAAQICHEHAA